MFGHLASAFYLMQRPHYHSCTWPYKSLTNLFFLSFFPFFAVVVFFFFFFVFTAFFRFPLTLDIFLLCHLSLFDIRLGNPSGQNLKLPSFFSHMCRRFYEIKLWAKKQPRKKEKTAFTYLGLDIVPTFNAVLVPNVVSLPSFIWFGMFIFYSNSEKWTAILWNKVCPYFLRMGQKIALFSNKF